MNTKKLAMAALAGLFTVGMVVASPAFAGEADKSGCTGKDTGKMEKANCKTADGREMHACKGQNSCEGNGGDAKNACKGQGSCATDGSVPENMDDKSDMNQ